MSDNSPASTTTVATKVHQRRVYTPQEVEENKVIYNYFDPNYVRQLNRIIFNKLNESYFRPVYIGFDEVIERNDPDRPVILASNHSGMAFPWDAMVFGCGMMKRFEYDHPKVFRTLVAPRLSGIPAMHPYFMKGSWYQSGGIDANFLNFETMMHYPKGNLLIYPEGVPGIGKGFNRKYQLQRLATSFIRMSLKYKTDIQPYSTINAEYVAPYMYSIDWVNRQFQKIGVPFMALGVLTIFLLFPWAFYLAFPVKMHFVRGRRLSPWKWIDKPFEDLTEEEIGAVRDKVREHMQEDLDKAVAEYGKYPFHFREWIGALWKHRRYFPYNIPLFYPFIFHEFERQWIVEEKYKTQEDIDIPLGWGAIFRLIWRNPITLAYFVPIIGWFILASYGKRRWRTLDHLGKPRAPKTNT